MSKKPPRLPRTPRSCPSPVQMEKTGSGSSQSSDSPIHWETLVGTDSPKTTKIKPSSWDNSDDELPLTLEEDISRGHIYSSESLSNRKSVAAEINDLKKQFFQAVVTETVTDIEDLREKLETSLRNDRRQSPARVRRRTKSSSSSSTVMDIPCQSSPKKEDEFNPQYEEIFDNTENTAPILELDSRFYLDNFFAELRRKRISILESTVGIINERDEEDFQEIATEDPNEFVNLSDCGYFNRSSRKLSQILEVEENKKDSDKDAEECSENTDLFLKFSRKPEDSDSSPLHTARSLKDEKLFENLKEEEYKSKFSSDGFKNCKKHRRDALAIASELDDEVISLTAKTGTIQLNSPNQKDVKKKNTNLHQIDDDDVNWTLIENLKLDLMKTPENSTPRRSSRRDRNSGSGSRRSTKDECLQSPKFTINLGKESARSLKVDEIKTPNSIGKNSLAESVRSIKDHKSSSGSAVQVAGNNLLDLKNPSLGSHSSNHSLELQHILLDQGMNTSRYSQRSDYANEIRDQAETSIGSEIPYRTNHSECSSRSVNSRSSRSSRSYRFSSRATESRMSSQTDEKLKYLEPLERVLSRRSSSVSSRTELELLRQTNTARSEKCASRSRNRELTKLTPQGTQTTTPRTSKSYTEDVRSESKGRSESFNSNERIPSLMSSEWIDVEKVRTISSNRSGRFLRSQTSSRSEIIISESLDREIPNDFMEELVQSRNSSGKSVITENSDNLDEISSSRSTKDKSRLNSCRSEERALLNISLNTDRSDEVKISGRTTERSGIIEECEVTPTQTLKNDSESDRRLSIINEVSFEDIEMNNIAENPIKSKRSSVAGSERTETGRTPKSQPEPHRSLHKQPSNELITKPESEGLWNDLIETFSADQDQPFNWQDNFLGFLNTNQNSSINRGKEPSSPTIENAKFFEYESGGKEEEGDLLLSRLRENVPQSPPKSIEASSARKHPEKKKDFLKSLDLDIENNLKKIKSDNDADNLYYFEVEKTGNFGIGEFGDVTCWNLDVPYTLEEGKPKGDGDGVLPQYHKETPILKEDNKEKKSKIQKQLWTNLENTGNFTSKDQKLLPTNDELLSFLHNDLEPSKSDTCINPIEFSQCEVVDSSAEKNKSNSEQKPLLFDSSGKRKRRADSSISSIQYSSSECLSDETDIQELDFENLRRTASLTDIAAYLRRSGYEKLESNENLCNSRSPLFEKVGKDTQDKNATNLNIFLARKKEEDKTEAKSNWLILKQSRGKTCHRENKKSKSRLTIDKSLIKKDSKEYLSFKSRPSIPSLKFKDSNCFQNFYKRVISVFCLTSSSSLPTSK